MRIYKKLGPYLGQHRVRRPQQQGRISVVQDSGGFPVCDSSGSIHSRPSTLVQGTGCSRRANCDSRPDGRDTADSWTSWNTGSDCTHLKQRYKIKASTYINCSAFAILQHTACLLILHIFQNRFSHAMAVFSPHVLTRVINTMWPYSCQKLESEICLSLSNYSWHGRYYIHTEIWTFYVKTHQLTGFLWLRAGITGDGGEVFTRARHRGEQVGVVALLSVRHAEQPRLSTVVEPRTVGGVRNHSSWVGLTYFLHLIWRKK